MSQNKGHRPTEAEVRYRALFDQSPDGILLIDPQGKILDFNEAAHRMLGYSREEFTGIDIRSLSLKSPEETQACIDRLASEGKCEFEGKYRTNNGEVRTIHVISSVVDLSGRTLFHSIWRDVSERKQAEEALGLSQERLARAQQIAHVGDWEWELATNAVHWSDELYRIYGYEPREIAPDYGLVVEAMHPHSRELFLQAINDALTGTGPFEMDYKFYRKDGSVAVLHTIGRVIRGADGGPVRMVGIVQDITSQRKAEDAVRESEAKFRGIFDDANDGILIVDSETRKFCEANRTICAMLGYTREELLTLGIKDIHPPGDLARVLAEFREQQKGGKIIAADLPVLRKDGTVFYSDIGTAFIVLGGAQYGIGIFRDITGRKKAEEELRNSREFVSSVLNTVDEAFIVVDADYRITMANSAYSRQTGIPVGDIFGKPCYEVSHQNTAPCHEKGEECAVRHTFDTGEPHACVHKHLAKDGGILYVETKSYPLKDASGKIVSAIEVINNITDKHLLEEQFLRTQKLEAVGLLAGGIAHDFNNLLQGVFGTISMAKLLSDRDGKPFELLEEAERALMQTRNLTKQLLTFSKGGEPVKKSVALPPLIHDSVKFALSGSNIDCVFSTADDLLAVRADEGQISQVMHNLVLNAAEAMPDGGTVSVEACNMPLSDKGALPLPKGAYVRISVKDYGIGIPESHLSRIFDPYFSTKKKGSGLGLTTSYSIVKKHGGLLDVKSDLGAGSTFFVYLPASGEMPVPEKAGKGRIVRGKGTVLLMDDEEVVRSVAGYMIKSLGYEIDFAENGEEAIEKYIGALNAARPFDAVILDLTVRGGMGGEETIRKMTSLDPAVRAIVSSGYSDSAILSHYEDYGFKAVLSKPYAIEELSSTLHQLTRPEKN